MRSGKFNYFVVGLFVLTMLFGLIASVALLTGRTGATDAYFTVYGNVTGIQFGTQVLYEGYPVGQVESVTPQPGDTGMSFRVDFTVTEGWRIPADSIAEIAAPGLLSAVTVSIRAGESTDALPPGSLVAGQERSDMFAAVSAVARDFTDLTETSVKPLLANLNRGVLAVTDFVENDARNLVGDAGEVSGDLAVRLPRIMTDAEVIAGNLLAITEDVQNLLNPPGGTPLASQINDILVRLETASTGFATLSEDLQDTRASTDQVLTTMQQVAGSVSTVVSDNRLDVDQSVVELRYILESISRHVDSINQNLEGASRNMYEFSRQIRNNPGVLIGGTPQEDRVDGQ